MQGVSMSSILWIPFVMCFIVTFIDLTFICLMIKMCILSLSVYLQYSELMEPYFWQYVLSSYNFSESLNFSFVKHNFKYMRTSSPSCVYMVMRWLFWFVRIKPICIISQFLLWVKARFKWQKFPILLPRNIVKIWIHIL